MKKRVKYTILNLLFLCLMVAIIAVVPTINEIKNNNGEVPLQKNFMGELSSFQGVITIWNVDTFESGSTSKTDYLTSVGLEFSKNNNGLYFLVKNVSVNEMLNSFMNGVYPDVISFGYGLGNTLKPLLMDLDSSGFAGVRECVLESGKNEDGALMALGYLMGGYILASTESKLTDAIGSSTTDLKAVINSAGYDTSIGKKEKHVASVVVGANEFVNPCTFMNNFSGLALTDYHLSSSGYDAYLDFVSYNAGTILVGTQRDLFKLSGRIKVGKIDGVIINYLEGYTNLVQYVGVMNNIMEEKKDAAMNFVSFLVSGDAQKISSEIGMVNVLGESYYEDGEMRDLEECLNKELIIPSIFTK